MANTSRRVHDSVNLETRHKTKSVDKIPAKVYRKKSMPRQKRQTATTGKPTEQPPPQEAAAPVPPKPEKNPDDVRLWNVYQRLSGVLEQTSAIPKSGRNEFQKYNFIEQAAIVAEIRNLLPRFRLFLKTEVTSCVIEGEQTKDQKPQDACKMNCRYSFINIDDPLNPDERVIYDDWPSLARDTSDKAVNKASTSNMKFFMVRTFLISDHDPDADNPDAGRGRGESHGQDRNPPLNERKRHQTRQDTLPSRPQHEEAPPIEERELPLEENQSGADFRQDTKANEPPQLDPANWREYVVDCGKGARGKKVGTFALPSLREMEATLEEFKSKKDRTFAAGEARTLVMVKAGIKELESQSRKGGPSKREELVAKLDNLLCKDADFIRVMHKYKLLDSSITAIDDIPEDLIETYLSDWRTVTDALDREDNIPGLK